MKTTIRNFESTTTTGTGTGDMSVKTTGRVSKNYIKGKHITTIVDLDITETEYTQAGYVKNETNYITSFSTFITDAGETATVNWTITDMITSKLTSKVEELKSSEEVEAFINRIYGN